MQSVEDNVVRSPLVELGEHIRAAQRALTEFLQIDIALAFAFLESAKVAKKAIHRDKLLCDARMTLETVRRFETRLKDRKTKRDIRARARQLAAAINMLSR